MEKNFSRLFKNKIVMVTGGIGSIGLEIVKQLIKYHPKEIRIFDNRETELFYTHKKLLTNKIVRSIFGDIRDKESLLRASRNVDIIFHAGAMKHVIICEWRPFEAVKTNVLGTQNIIECAIQNNIERVVMVSTDKAVNPTNVMGATKLLAERLVSAICNQGQTGKMKFSVVRFGNVLASRGSVLEIWERQLKERNKIIVTNPEMTRFFMSIPDSVKLIFNATYMGKDGETFIFKMPAVKIGVLAETFLELYGEKSTKYEVVGSQPGEKMHEELINIEEEKYLLENNKMFIRLPIFFNQDFVKRFKKLGFNKSKTKSFSSNDTDLMLNTNQIKKILKNI